MPQSSLRKEGPGLEWTLPESLLVQVIVDGVDRHLNRLLKTVAAVQDMKVPQGCSKQIHIIHNGR